MEYILHQLTIFLNCDTEETRIAALLYDVVEDTKITFEDLSMFFDEKIIEAVKLLSRPRIFNNEEYYRNIKNNPIARKVKIEYLRTNMDLTRIDSLKEWLESRINKKNKPAFNYLNEKLNYPLCGLF